MTHTTLLELDGVTGIDILELQEELPEGAVTPGSAETTPLGDHGDLGLTAAVVILSAAVIHGLAVWLAKRRVQARTLAECTIDETPEGRRISLRVERTASLSEPPDPEVVAALQSHLEGLMQAAGT